MREVISNKKNRNEKLDILRGIAILIVIYSHALLCVSGDSISDIVLYRIIIPFHMPLLFFISGYAVGFSFPTNSLLQYTKKKILRLVVPYICWVTIYSVILQILNTSRKELNIQELIYNYYSSEFWFLRVLFIMNFVLCIFNSFYIKYAKYRYSTFIFGAIIVYFIEKYTIFGGSLSLTYWCFFCLGIIMKENDLLDRKIEGNGQRIVFILSIVVFSAITLLIVNGIHIDSKFTAIIYICSICLFVLSGPDKLLNWLRKFCGLIGENTLPFYAIHWCLLFAPIYVSDYRIEIMTDYPWYISSSAIATIWVVICYFVTILLNKNRTIRFLLLGAK